MQATTHSLFRSVAAVVLVAALAVVGCGDDTGGPEEMVSSLSYRVHEDDVDSNALLKAYPNIAGIRIHDCQTCCAGPPCRPPRSVASRSDLSGGRLFRQFQHPLDRGECASPDSFVHRDLGSFIAHAEIEFLDGVETHVRTLVTRARRVRWCGNVFLLRSRFLHLMDDSRLGGDDEGCCRVLDGEFQ